jgi:hypothetical protein
VARHLHVTLSQSVGPLRLYLFTYASLFAQLLTATAIAALADLNPPPPSSSSTEQRQSVQNSDASFKWVPKPVGPKACNQSPGLTNQNLGPYTKKIQANTPKPVQTVCFWGPDLAVSHVHQTCCDNYDNDISADISRALWSLCCCTCACVSAGAAVSQLS